MEGGTGEIDTDHVLRIIEIFVDLFLEQRALAYTSSAMGCMRGVTSLALALCRRNTTAAIDSNRETE